MEGEIWPTQKFWCSAPMPDPGRGRGRERNGKGEEGQEGGKVEGKLEQGRRMAKAGPDLTGFSLYKEANILSLAT